MTNSLIIGDDKLPRAKIIQDVAEASSISIDEVGSILVRFCVKPSREHDM